MFRWLLQWLNSFLQYLLGGTGIIDTQPSQEHLVADQPPELSNADLEFLFNELLEGVHQARGQQWALKYLQRMEQRITIDRWIDWLLGFGDKLLASPSPNYHLANRLVQLGELGIGDISNLAYDIGVQLLRRNLNQEDQPEQESQEIGIARLIEEELDTPGQELIRQFGEELWEYQSVDAVKSPSVSQMIEDLLTGESIGISNQSLPEDIDENIGENTHPVHELSDDDYQSYEYAVKDLPKQLQKVVADSLSLREESSNQSLVNIEPQLASTLDQLVLGLEQNTSLAQQLASELAIRDQKIVSQGSFGIVVNQAQALFYQGLQQAKTGDLLTALALYELASKLDPSEYQYWLNQGLTLFYLERFPEAIAAYDQTLALKPNLSKVWYSRGGILGELGDFEGQLHLLIGRLLLNQTIQKLCLVGVWLYSN